MEKFKSQGGANVQEFCEHGTREECRRNRNSGDVCKKVIKIFKVLHLA